MSFTKSKPLDKEVALEITEDFLEKFEFCCNEQSAPNPADLEKFLTKNFQVSSNGKILAKSLDEYVSRIAHFQKKYSHLEISNLSVDVLSSGYQIVARYSLFLTPRDHSTKRQVELIAIASIEDHHFSKWDQVANEFGAEHWDINS